MNLKDMQETSLANSRTWFPPPADVGDRWEIEHQALGLVGETGEVIEHVKKWHRGDFNVPELRHRLADELPDVLIYLMNLAELLGLDLETQFIWKTEMNFKRWQTTDWGGQQ